jgi:hypothetical protein
MLRALAAGALLLLPVVAGALSFSPLQAGENGRDLIRAAEMQQWLTYFSSDEFEGRRTYSEGLGLAAAYLADQLKSWGVKPAGDNGSYFQLVRVLGVKSDNHSSITVEANGQTRTFAQRQGIVFPANVGKKRSFTSDQIEFMGYGLDLPQANHRDYAGRNVKGKVVIWLGAAGPQEVDAPHRRLLSGRARYATDVQGAIASIGPVMFGGVRPEGMPAAAPQAGAGQRPDQPVRTEVPDFTTVQRLDNVAPATASGQDDFFEFLFSGQEAGYAELRALAADRKPLPIFALKNVKLTLNLDADYRVVRTQFTRNVVGMVEGGDPKLKNTCVAYGAHYDHMGYAEGEIVQTPNGPQRAQPPGRVKAGALEDRIWNGADDDGSGCITLMALAKAFRLGPRPRRSVLFVFHTGEENGLLGSRFYADYPTVPLENIVAQINLDMVGRNSEDKPEEANSVDVVGSDRISTELHNITVAANDTLSKPLRLDFALNDPSDPEQIYYRSDHYSYAAKGIPVVFFTTGLHPDYHYNTDSAEKINYEKMERIAQLCYEIGMHLAQMDHAPVHDNLGPRAGRGSTGRLER